MVSAAHALLLRFILENCRWNTHPLLAWDADLPFEEVHGAIRGLRRLCVEALQTNTVRQHLGSKWGAVGLTKGWSLRHCFRSSARRALQIPDIVYCEWEKERKTKQGKAECRDAY